jgi:hypothetical protein
MSLGDDFDFRQKLNNSTSIYELVNEVASKARKLAEDTDNVILHSESLSYICRELDIDLSQFKRLTDYEERYLREQFCYIDDPAVKDSVRESFKRSKESGKLTFVYCDVASKSKRSRIRVITRMLYYTLVR